jgi:hypothetical protein
VTRLPTATRARAVLSFVAMALAAVLVIGALASRVGSVAPDAAAGAAPEATATATAAAPAAATAVGSTASGAVAGSVSKVIVVDEPVQVVADRSAVFAGVDAIYTWRAVTFTGTMTTLRWAIVAPRDEDCRLDWRIKPADGDAQQGIGTTIAGGRDDGLVRYDEALATGTLTVVSDCASWIITLRAAG